MIAALNSRTARGK
jgi:hypothetical protein